MLRSIGIAAAVAAVALVQSASAQSDKSLAVAKVVVAYDDLNLADPRDAATMLDRIDHAAVRACGGRPMFSKHYNENPVAATEKYRKCHGSVMTKAVGDLNAPEVAKALAEADK